MGTEEIERLGELLIEEGVITQEELLQAISETGLKGSALAAALESVSHPKRRELAVFLATDFRIPKVPDLRQVDFQAEARQLVPEDLARKHEFVPLARIGSILCVAKSHFFNKLAIQDIRRATGLKVKVLLADEMQVRSSIDFAYGKAGVTIPAPKVEKKETVFRRVQPPPVLEASGIPLISRPEPAAAAPSRAAAVQAIKVTGSDASDGDALADRLLREWDDLFVQGRPSAPIKVG